MGGGLNAMITKQTAYDAENQEPLIGDRIHQMGEVSERERKIVVAVDEGEESLYALSWCLKNVIFENSKDTLILLYARPPRPIYTAMDGTGSFSFTSYNTSSTYSLLITGVGFQKKNTCRSVSQTMNYTFLPTILFFCFYFLKI